MTNSIETGIGYASGCCDGNRRGRMTVRFCNFERSPITFPTYPVFRRSPFHPPDKHDPRNAGDSGDTLCRGQCHTCSFQVLQLGDFTHRTLALPSFLMFPISSYTDPPTPHTQRTNGHGEFSEIKEQMAYPVSQCFSLYRRIDTSSEKHYIDTSISKQL